jgi:hypothetical protein
MNIKFPTMVVDNFLDDPMGVREFALTLPYKEGPNYPGVWSELLNNISPSFHKNLVRRILKIFYNIGPTIKVEYKSTSVFQKVNIMHGDRGWVHRDSGVITGIIYLNPEYNKDSGTIICEPKNPVLYDTSVKNNDQYNSSIILQNKFNRLACFDSQLLHAGNEFGTSKEQEDRLTLVVFITQLSVSNENFPLIRMRSII